MKKLLVILLAAAMAALCGCSRGGNDEGWRDMLDTAILLPSQFSTEKVEKCLPPEEVEFNKASSLEKRNADYYEELRGKYDSIKTKYDEKYGEDWQLHWELREAVVKDKDGIKKYLDYDSYFFETYGIDTAKISSVTFAKITVKIEGSKGSGEKDKTVQCFRIGDNWYSFYSLAVGSGL